MSRTALGGVIIAAAAFIALASVLYQGGRAGRCSYDGTAITPVYEVDIRLKDGRAWKFCSITCARAMFEEHRDEVETVVVTDEVTGEKLASSAAYFVESDVVTNKVTRNRVHVFKYEEEALSHARRYNGRLVEDPFKQ
jgi:hypothetical protein